MNRPIPQALKQIMSNLIEKFDLSSIRNARVQDSSLEQDETEAQKLDILPIRGSIDNMAAYLGSAQLSVEEFVKYKPEVPAGLLKALGLSYKSVPLPTEDPASILKTAVARLLAIVPTRKAKDSEYVVVGTESIVDGSLPLSNHVLSLLPHSNVMSSEQKHACIAAMNAVWDKVRDIGVIAATDIAHYSNDEQTAPSAEFTGGAGAVALFSHPKGKLLDILDIRGFSSSLVYDFYKPYRFSGDKIFANNYPLVFGKYSNLSNFEQVTKAYIQLKCEAAKQNTNLQIRDFSGIVLHTPYPGITRYNVAMLVLIDNIRNGLLERVAEDENVELSEFLNYPIESIAGLSLYQYLSNLFDLAHTAFNTQNFLLIAEIEKEVKSILKDIMKGTENSNAIFFLQQVCNDFLQDDGEDACKNILLDLHQLYLEAMEKLKPSLVHISKVSNIYTGSSPLCMMSWLENANYGTDEYILWGGYGSGNQAMFTIAKTKPSTAAQVDKWKTKEDLAGRKELNDEEFLWVRSRTQQSLKDFIIEVEQLNYLEFDDVQDSLVIPKNAYFLNSLQEFQRPEYIHSSNIESKTKLESESLFAKVLENLRSK